MAGSSPGAVESSMEVEELQWGKCTPFVLLELALCNRQLGKAPCIQCHTPLDTMGVVVAPLGRLGVELVQYMRAEGKMGREPA